MQLELDSTKADLLREVLDIAVHDLSYEISSADRPAYRDMLRQRRRILSELLEAVGGPIPNVERFAPAASSQFAKKENS